MDGTWMQNSVICTSQVVIIIVIAIKYTNLKL